MCNGSVGRGSGAHVVDRRGAGIVPIGIESFADVVGRFVYVDNVVTSLEEASHTSKPTLTKRNKSAGRYMRVVK